jgi:DNA-nicking Smr family endonuclease
MINEADKQLFRSTIDNDIAIDKDCIQAPNNQPKQPAFTTYSHIYEARLSGSEIVNYAKNGISTKIIKQMQRGDISYAPILDLHGHTIIEACELMSQFMYHHQNEHFIHIIHGKGYRSKDNMSVLKTQVVSFLTQHPQVIAFNSCPAKDGGTGAIFALLKQ